jgi:aldehyde:ferredoxin oxidoreductase
VESLIAQELGANPRRLSVFSIGPAGEHLVRFATLAGDRGHVAAHNGIGAVMGSKRLKAIAVARGNYTVRVSDPEALATSGKAMFDGMMQNTHGRLIYQWGTAGHMGMIYAAGMLPVRNYTTNLFPEHEQLDGQYMRTHFEEHPKPCWACRVNHVRSMRVTEGPYTGQEGEEPEYEVAAAFGGQIGNTDAGAVLMLGNTADRLGLDCNELGWTVGWTMECFEKGLLARSDLDGLELSWGWADFSVEEAQDVGRRAINRLRVFNFRHGLDVTCEAPSARYCSTPVDGPAQGVGIAEHFASMRRDYWEKMGWDPQTGRPLPQTLRRLGLKSLIKDLA